MADLQQFCREIYQVCSDYGQDEKYTAILFLIYVKTFVFFVDLCQFNQGSNLMPIKLLRV